MRSHHKVLAALLGALLLGGCAVTRVAENLPYGLLNNDDPELVGAALPSFIVTLDGLLVTWPDDAGLLRSGSSLYAAYATLVVTDPPRSRRLATRALDYALRGACAERDEACGLRAAPFADFEQVLRDTDKDDLAWMYTLGSAWAGWIQLNSDDWAAVAELARVQALFDRIVAIAPAHERGMPQLYLGVLASLLPPSLGGKPEVAKAYYEQAIALSNGRNLYARLLYAKQYARLLYDRELHDAQLNAVLAAEPHEHGWTLSNVYAQQEARRLLDGADDYF